MSSKKGSKRGDNAAGVLEYLRYHLVVVHFKYTMTRHSQGRALHSAPAWEAFPLQRCRTVVYIPSVLPRVFARVAHATQLYIADNGSVASIQALTPPSP